MSQIAEISTELQQILKLVDFDNKSLEWARKLFPIILKATTKWEGEFEVPKLDLDLVLNLLLTREYQKINRKRHFNLIKKEVPQNEFVSIEEGSRHCRCDIVFTLEGFLLSLVCFRTPRSREIRKFQVKCTVGFSLYLANEMQRMLLKVGELTMTANKLHGRCRDIRSIETQLVDEKFAHGKTLRENKRLNNQIHGNSGLHRYFSSR